MKHLKPHGTAHPLSGLLATALLSAGLSACGGGSGDNAGTASPAVAETASTSMPSAALPPPTNAAPSLAPVPAPTPEPDPYAAVAGSEPALVVAQRGSAADVGNGSEGLYDGPGGYTFVSSTGEIARQLVSGTVWGSLAVTGQNWTFKPGTQLYLRTFVPLTGSGTFSPGISMDGTYSRSGETPAAWGPLTYSSMNALAVAQSSVAGRWTRAEADGIGMSVDVDAEGAFAGRTFGSQIGVCRVSGSVQLAQPQTAKNLYTMAMTAVNAAAAGEPACTMNAKPYAGFSAIVHESAGLFVANGYFKSLTFLVRTSGGSTLSLGMRKQ